MIGGATRLGAKSRAGAVDGRNNLAKRRSWFFADGAHHVDELDNAEAPLTAFVLGHEGLRLAEAPGEFLLGQAMPLAQRAQLLAEHDLARRAQGIAHDEGPGSTAAAPAHNPIFGLSHFGIKT